MKKLPFLLGLLLCSMGLLAQQSLLVFLEASEKKPFYVKIGSKINVSTSNGQVYITELNGSSFDIFIGFPETDLPEQRFQINLKKSDNSFQLKQANQGWQLIDLDNDKVIQPAPPIVSASMPLGGVRKTDAFSIMMAGVVNDTSVLYTSVINHPPAVNEPAVAAANPAVKTPVTASDPGASDQAVKTPNQADKKNEKQHASAFIDSTKVKHVDSSLAMQKSQAQDKAVADSLSRTAEKTADNAVAKNDSSAGAAGVGVVGAKNAVSDSQTEQAKKEDADKAAISKDSADKAAGKDVAAKETANDVAVKETAKDVTAKEAAATELLAREAATRDSLAKITAANEALARANNEKDSLARVGALKDSLARETAAKESAAKESAAKEATDKENALKVAAAREAATKEALDKETAAKDAIVKEKAFKDSVYKASLKNKTAGSGSSEVKKIGEKKSERALTVSYIDKSDGKTDTIEVIIAIDPAASVVPKKDSIFPRWQSNPRPLTDPVVTKKDSGSSSYATNTQPLSRGPVMINSDCVNFATEYDLDKLRVKMMAEVSADDRIAAAKKVFRTKCFTCRQIRALTELFLNDEGKYKFLDTAYPFVSDSQEFRNLVTVLKEDYYIKRFNAMIRI